MSDTEALPDFVRGGVNLATPRLGAEAVYATDDFFADKSRMLSDAAPVFIPDKYDEHGKWMDGWESRRRRDGGHDFCVVRLGAKGRLTGVEIDTSHFTGNYPPHASLEAALAEDAGDAGTRWVEVVPRVKLGPSARHFHAIGDRGIYNHVRLHIFPDGGVARLRVYGEPVPEWDGRRDDATYELSALGNGGRIVAYNDAHYGSVWTLLLPGRGINMGDGWETRRRREPGNDWIIVRLGASGTVERIEVDTAHYKGNFPDRCSVDGAVITGGDAGSIDEAQWRPLLAEQKLKMDAIHVFDGAGIANAGPVSHVRLNIFPDGGVSRLRVFGRLAR